MPNSRYERQIALPGFSVNGQQQVNNSRVACVGLGGLGSPSSTYLALSGVGQLTLIDGDYVAVNNLHRQTLFTERDVDSPKATTAARRLLQFNPEIRINPVHTRLSSHNALELLKDHDLILSGCDNFETQFLINDASHALEIPWIHAAIDRHEGQIALFNSRLGPCYRCLYPAPPVHRAHNCSESGVLGPAVGMLGCLQSNMALQFLISRNVTDHPLSPEPGLFYHFDLRAEWDFRKIRIPKNDACVTCSLAPGNTNLQAYSGSPCSLSNATPSRTTYALSCQTLALDLLSYDLYDVRSSEEWIRSRIPGSTHWPLERIERGEYPPESKTGRSAVFYCKSGYRSQRAAELLADAGRTNAFNLIGGYQAWRRLAHDS